MESRAFVLGCLLVALTLRLIVVALNPIPTISDFEWYLDRAAELAAGRGVVFRGEPTAYWPPGYAFFLAPIFAVTGPSVLAAQLANVALALASLCVAWWIALRLTGSRIAAGFTLAVLAVYPNHIAYVALVANEHLVTFLLLAGVALLLVDGTRARWPVLTLAGAVFGFAALVKPQTVILAAVVLVWSAWRARGGLRPLAVRLAVVYAVVAIVIAPWMARNHRKFGRTVLVANSGGVNLYLGNNPDATGGYPPNAIYLRLWAELHRTGGDEVEVDRRGARLAIDWATRKPLAAIALVPRKLWHLYAKDADGISWIEESRQAIGTLTFWKVVAQVAYVGLGALFIAALVSQWLGRKRAAPRCDPLPLAVVATFTVIYCAYFGMSRYHFPLVPWIAMYAGAFVASLVAAWEGRRAAALAVRDRGGGVAHSTR